MSTLWPHTPNGRIVVPVQGPQQRPLAFLITMDALYLTDLVNGVPVEPAHHHPNTYAHDWPLVEMKQIEFGTVETTGPCGLLLSAMGQNGPTGYLTQAGPAVWIRGFVDIVIPYPQPERLAQELLRRRHRIAQFGGFNALRMWQRFPYLQALPNQGADPLPGPALAPEARWTSAGKPRAVPPENPSERLSGAEPLAGASPPEQWTTFTHPAGNGTLTVDTHRLYWARQPVATATSLVEEPTKPLPTNEFAIPLAALPIIESGEISGLRDTEELTFLLPDGSANLVSPLRNGPALWLWGPKTDWVFCTPDAETLAEHLRQRRRTCYLYPYTGMRQAERRVWSDYPELRPLDNQYGRFAPPPPPYAPSYPTSLNPGHWHAAPAAT